MAKRRTWTELMNETRALAARREYLSARVTQAHLESLALQEPVVAITSYRNALRGLVERADGALTRDILPALGSDIVSYERAMQSFQLDLSAAVRQLERSAGAAFKRTTEHARSEAQRILGVKIPADLNAEVMAREAFVSRQARLMQDAAVRQLTRLREQALAGKPLQMKALYANANQVAFNECAKLARAELGRWSEMAGSPGGFVVVHRDEKLRDTHAAIAGQFYPWASPPPEHSEVNCRCSLVPAEVALR